MNHSDDLLERAAAGHPLAEAILIGAGAGMGVDSGLPDFRGGQGFWKAYPPYARARARFRVAGQSAAVPRATRSWPGASTAIA